MLHKILSTLAVFFLFGCATPSNEADFKKMTPSQRLYMGRLHVLMNGEKPEKCELFMNGSLVPTMKIAADGYIIYRTENKTPGLAQLTCLHQVSLYKSAWHVQDFDLAPFKRSPDQSTIHYFGDLTVNWIIDPKLTASAPVIASDPGLSKVGTVKDSGELHVTVENKLAEAKAYAAEHWSIAEGKKIEAAIVATTTE